MSDQGHRHPDHPSTKRSRRRARGAGRAKSSIGSWGERTADPAYALFLRGREAEDAGDIDGALDLYARALAIPEAERHPADTGAILHHMGRCALVTGDKDAAWEIFAGSARHDHGCPDKARLERYGIAASLGEAGMLLVDYRPPRPISETVSHALLLAGAVEALDQAVAGLLGPVPPTVRSAMPIHRSLTGLMILASGAGAAVILEQGALALYNRVALPFSERHDVRRGAPVDDIRYLLARFQALAQVWQAVGRQERPERAGTPPTWEEVEGLTSHAAIAFHGAPWPLMFRWLGSYLRDRRGAAWASDETLALMIRI